MFPRRLHLATLMGMLLAIATACTALPNSSSPNIKTPNSNDPQTRATRSYEAPTEDLSLFEVPGRLSYFYSIPISTEIHPSYSAAEKDFPFKVPFYVHKGESLATCLDRYVAASHGLQTWAVIHGNIVVTLKKQNEDEKLSPMDRRISLELNSASTWEAFKAFQKAINSLPDTQNKLDVVPVPCMNLHKMQPEFADIHTISLKLDNVTAREAACAIMEASPISLSFSYFEPTAAPCQFWIWLYKDGRIDNAGVMTEEETMAWVKRLKE